MTIRTRRRRRQKETSSSSNVAQGVVSAGRAAFYELAPYFDRIVYQMQPTIIPDAQWPHGASPAATDKHGRVVLKEGHIMELVALEQACRQAIRDETQANGLAASLLASEWCHEAWHLLGDDFNRASQYGGNVRNLAGDAAHNPSVRDIMQPHFESFSADVQAFLKANLPGGTASLPFYGPGYFPKDIPTSPNEGLTLEAYAALLDENGQGQGGNQGEPGEPGQGQGQGQGQPGQGQPEPRCCGSAAGHEHPAEALLPDAADDQNAVTEDQWEDARNAVANAVQKHAKSHGKGSVPGGLLRWAEDKLAPTPVPWQRILASEVRGALRRAGATDFTYAKPSRRQVPNVILPTLRSPDIRVAVVCDTSASRNDAEITGDLSDVQGLLRTAGVSEVRFLAVDYHVQEAETITSVAAMRKLLKGNGGTNMIAGIEEAATVDPNTGERPHLIVVLTDGETSWPQRAVHGVRTLAVVPEGVPSRYPIPSWMRVVERKA
jgi:hypothetical protein